jgi:hypothetical protein
LEAVICLTLMAIIALVIFPAFVSFRLESRLKSDVLSLDRTFRQARNMAATNVEPVRVVVDCSRRFLDGCATSIQTPILDRHRVVGWGSHSGPRMRLDVRAQVVKAKEASGHDGLLTRPDVCWAVFMPDGQVLSDPNPFVILIRDMESAAGAVAPWRLAIDRETGAIATGRASW